MLEVQFHPADIRKEVRYYFLSRSVVRWIVIVAVVLTLVLAAGLLLAPLGVRALLLSSELKLERHHNEQLRAILSERREDAEEIARQVASARLLLNQMSLILGVPAGDSGGGGFPESVRPDLRLQPAREAMVLAARMATESRALLAMTEDVARYAQDHDELTDAVPSICPLPVGTFVLTSPFGERVSPFTNSTDFHAGLDLAAREGTPVMAAGAGRVVFAGRFPLKRNVRWWRYGNVVVLAHSDRYMTIYAHLHEIMVEKGQAVARGEVVGSVGNTGWSTAPHLHYEVRLEDYEENPEPTPVDPRAYILNYRWTGHEELLARSRAVPAPSFDPLPSLVRR